MRICSGLFINVSRSDVSMEHPFAFELKKIPVDEKPDSKFRLHTEPQNQDFLAG
jgi:hypothetical protein